MSEKNKEGTNEAQANPYNMKKSWHTESVMPTDLQNADSGLFVPNPDRNKVESSATTQKSNPEDSNQVSTATMDKVQESALNVESNPYNKVDYKKRYDDLKRYYDRKLGEWNSKESDLKTQLRENRPKYTPPKSKEELDSFKKDYPDIYGVVETVSHLQSENQMQTLQEEVDSLKKQNNALAQREAQLELARIHPDYNNIKDSDEIQRKFIKQFNKLNLRKNLEKLGLFTFPANNTFLQLFSLRILIILPN